MTELGLLVQLQKKHNNIAFVYATLGNLMLVLMQICMKKVSLVLGPIYTLCVRAFFLSIVNYAVMLYNNSQINVRNPRGWRILLLRNILSPMSVLCTLVPLAYISAGTTQSLFNTQAIIIIFVQAIYYKKSINYKHLALTLVCFIGVILIIKPPFLFGYQENSAQQNQLFYLIVLIGAALYALSMLLLRQLKDLMQNITALQYFYIAQVFFFGLLTNVKEYQIQQQNMNFEFYFGICGLVFAAYCTQFCITRSIFLKQPSIVAPFGYIAVVFASISDIVIFNDKLQISTIFGILLTSSGLLSKVLIKEQQSKK